MIDLSPEFYFQAIITLSIAYYLFTTYVSLRQFSVYRHQKKMPKSLTGICKQAEYDKSRAYGHDKMLVGLIFGFIGMVVSLAELYYGMMPWVWGCAKTSIVKYAGEARLNEYSQSIVFGLINSVIAIPLSLISGYISIFYVEQKHGFNKQTVGLWLKDSVKGFFIGSILQVIISALLIGTIKWGGQNFYFATWLAFAIFQILMVYIQPNIIMPLFNKFTNLEESELRAKIDALAKKVAFPLTKVFVMDGSTRSSHSNAFFTGLFKDRRIVIFDTMLEQMDHEEICAILGHELGHWKLSHIVKRLGASQLYIFTIFYLFSKMISERNLYAGFGFDKEMPIVIGLALFQSLLIPVSALIGWGMTLQSRAHEFEADQFSHGLGYSKELQTSLIKLHEKNGAMVPPDWLYSSINHSHPPLTERLQALKNLSAGSKKTK